LRFGEIETLHDACLPAPLAKLAAMCDWARSRQGPQSGRPWLTARRRWRPSHQNGRCSAAGGVNL